MADVHTKEQRSFNMGRILSKDTKPEMLVRRFLHRQGFRYRIHDNSLPGKPDIVLPKYRTVIFVNGCFWHGHTGCRYFVLPKTREEWWKNKIDKTRESDRSNIDRLIQDRWNVINVFECELKKDKLDTTLRSIVENLKKHNIL